MSPSPQLCPEQGFSCFPSSTADSPKIPSGRGPSLAYRIDGYADGDHQRRRLRPAPARRGDRNHPHGEEFDLPPGYTVSLACDPLEHVPFPRTRHGWLRRGCRESARFCSDSDPNLARSFRSSASHLSLIDSAPKSTARRVSPRTGNPRCRTSGSYMFVSRIC